MPLVISIMATGKNKLYQIVVSIAIAMNFIFSWILLRLGFPPETIFYIKVAISIFVLIIRMFFAKKQNGFSLSQFIRCVLVPCIIVALIVSILQTISYPIDNTWSNRLAATLILEIILFITVFFIGLTKSEKHTILTMCKKIIKNNKR